MTQITDTLRDSKRIRLIATALELMQYERTDSAVIPIPGTEPQRYVVVGTAATVARLLEIAQAAPVAKAVPEGWKLVPIEPTLEMQQAGFDTPGAHMYAASYRAMLAAAPAAPTAQEVTQQAAKAEPAEQAKPVARLHEETSDRPFTEGKKYFEITILDRARCYDGMELFAPTTSTVSAPEKVQQDWAKWIVQRGLDLPDHACAECVPGGGIIKAGFQCVYHQALALRTTTDKREAA